MKFKRFVYILLILLTSFVYMNGVSAGTNMYCRYQSGSNFIDLYCADNSESKCETIFIKKSDNKYIFTNGTVKSVKFDKGNDKCPSYANKDMGNKYKFGKGIFGNYDLSLENYSNNVSTFDISYNAKDVSVGDVSITVNRNSYGFLKYNLSNRNAGSTINIYNYSNNSSVSSFCKTSFVEKGIIEFDLDTCSSKDSVVSKDNSSSGNSNSGSSNSGTSSSGSSSSGGLGVGGYCVYKNLGYCAGDDGDINGDCGAFSNDTSGKKSSYFVRSKYAVFKYSTNNSDSFESVYLPKYTVSNKGTYIIDSSISKKVSSDFNAFDGTTNKLSSMLKNFSSFSKNELSTLNSYNTSTKTNSKGCPLWFSNVDGASGYDYDDSMYWYQLYDTNPENNTNTEDPDVVSSGVVVDAGKGPYYCIYDGSYGSVNTKTGTLALFFDTEKSRLKLLSYDFSTAYLNSKCSLDDCSTVDGVKFVGYGGYESNDGSFQSNFVAATTATCPKQINYNYNKGVLTICKDESDECINGGGGILGNINRFSNYYDNGSGGNIIDITSCDDLISDDLRKILNKYFLAFRIIVPLLVLALGIIDFAKTVFVSKEDDMKKTQQTFIKRLIVAVAIFFIPTFVNLLLDVANTVWGWNTGTCEIEKIDE